MYMKRALTSSICSDRIPLDAVDTRGYRFLREGSEINTYKEQALTSSERSTPTARNREIGGAQRQDPER